MTRKRIHQHACREYPAEYTAFCDAKGRCEDPKRKNYHNYGGRGIEVRFTCFDDFMDHIGPRPGKGYSLDRIDNNGHYEAGNVRWTTNRQQCRNKQKTPFIEHNGVIKPLVQIAEELGIRYETLRARHLRGEPPRYLFATYKLPSHPILRKS